MLNHNTFPLLQVSELSYKCLIIVVVSLGCQVWQLHEDNPSSGQYQSLLVSISQDNKISIFLKHPVHLKWYQNFKTPFRLDRQVHLYVYFQSVMRKIQSRLTVTMRWKASEIKITDHASSEDYFFLNSS